MLTHEKCDFCGKEIKTAEGLLFAPRTKKGESRKYQVCARCFKTILRVLRKGVEEIEDILSVGPQWLNYTRRVKRKKK